MSAYLNKVFFIGRLGADPEVRALQNGEPVANMSLALNKRWRGSDGEMEERTDWLRLVAFRRPAEIARDYLRKGSQVHVEGKLRTRSYTPTEESAPVTVVEVIVGKFQMLDKRESAGDEEPESEDDDIAF